MYGSKVRIQPKSCALKIILRTVYQKSDLSNEYKKQFSKLGIEDEDTMVDILNCLREITGICYSAYRKGITV